ncbi:hypothetical protein N7461_001419 [Penicillium sp. DV-2018c]|nr:hypothetical protein N7461_001419 [Penicillium sp. DV-2018c]
MRIWKLVKPPKGARVLTGKWVFKLKLNAFGKPLKFKARWVARGFEQIKDIDYSSTLARTGRYETLRVLLGVIAQQRLVTCHVDVNVAYLNAPLKERILMHYPTGLDTPEDGIVCQLERSLYGLKQSASNWFETPKGFLLSIGFVQSKADGCLYIRTDNDGGDTEVVYIFVYVDDMLIAGSSTTLVNKVKAQLSSQWSITDLGPLSHYLSMHVRHDRTKGTLNASQKAYVDRFTDEFIGETKRQITKPVTPLMDILIKSDHQATKAETKQYQSIIGSLNYANTVTRPDLALAISMLSQFLNNPDHHDKALRAVTYAGNTSDHSLHYHADDQHGLWGHVDASSYASGPDSKSRCGYVFFFAGGPISWKSKLQSSTAKSSAEAEYMGLSVAGSEAIWLSQLLRICDSVLFKTAAWQYYQSIRKSNYQISDHQVVKWGPDVMKEEAENQRIAYELVDNRIVHIPRVYAFFSDEQGWGYIVMEYIEGKVIDPLEDINAIKRLRVCLIISQHCDMTSPGLSLAGSVAGFFSRRLKIWFSTVLTKWRSGSIAGFLHIIRNLFPRAAS